MYNFGIGGNEAPRDASEGIAEIPMNRTLMIEKLTEDEAFKPKIVEGLKSVDDVFAHYKPSVEVEFQKEDGSSQAEQLHFSNLGNFGAKGITNQSNFLKDLDLQKNEYAKIIKGLKSNKVLKNVLENPESKAAFLNALQAMVQEIEEAK